MAVCSLDVNSYLSLSCLSGTLEVSIPLPFCVCLNLSICAYLSVSVSVSLALTRTRAHTHARKETSIQHILVAISLQVNKTSRTPVQECLHYHYFTLHQSKHTRSWKEIWFFINVLNSSLRTFVNSFL